MRNLTRDIRPPGSVPDANGALDSYPNKAMTRFRNFIGGEWLEPAGGEYFENRNPADTGDVIGQFPRSDARDVALAVASARRGFERWRRTPAPARGDVLRRAGDLLASRKDAIADLMTREMGKPLAETRGDVQEGINYIGKIY